MIDRPLKQVVYTSFLITNCSTEREQHDYGRLVIVVLCMCVQSLMVTKAKEELEQEIVDKEEKQRYLAEKAPPLHTGGMTLAQLQVIDTQRNTDPSVHIPNS